MLSHQTALEHVTEHLAASDAVILHPPVWPSNRFCACSSISKVYHFRAIDQAEKNGVFLHARTEKKRREGSGTTLRVPTTSLMVMEKRDPDEFFCARVRARVGAVLACANVQASRMVKLDKLQINKGNHLAT